MKNTTKSDSHSTGNRRDVFVGCRVPRSKKTEWEHIILDELGYENTSTFIRKAIEKEILREREIRKRMKEIEDREKHKTH